MSQEIDKLATALAIAQGQVEGAGKSSTNPFFKSKYADLQSVWSACRKALSDNGLSILQSPSTDGLRVTVETLLLHSSGQWVKGAIAVSAKEDTPQAVGSAITYLKRYALQSFAGVAPEDDDGEAAQGRGKAKSHVQVPAAPKGFEDWLTDLDSVSDEGTPALKKAWEDSKAEYRQYLTATNLKLWESMKERAATMTTELLV